MGVDALSSSLAGVRAGVRRLEVASHNVANLLTEDFGPRRTVQVSRAEGGADALVEPSGRSASVDLAQEFLQMDLGRLQSDASLRAIETQLDLLGSLIDIEA
jgi:flagellar hook-associated protein FlgK